MEQATGMLSERASKVIKPIQDVFEGVDHKYTCCYQNGCFGTLCILKCNVRDNKIIAVEPDDTIHPNVAREDLECTDDFEHGLWQHRPCAQGHAWRWEVSNPARLKTPMKRVAWDERGQGVFEPISWEEAADIVADKVAECREKFGPHTLLYSNEPALEACAWTFDRWTDVGIGCWGNISWSGPDTACKFWLGWDLDMVFQGKPQGRMATDANDVLNSNLIILWGWNVCERDFQAYPNYLKLAREKGIPVICIDPVYHWTSEVLADQWIPIRPQSDAAMMLAMAYVLFEQDLLDHEYMEKWVDMEGVPKFKAYVMGDEDGEPKTPEWAEGICGVPAETIRELAVMYGTVDACHLHYNIGMGRAHRGEYSAALSGILQAMTGNFSKHGGNCGPMDTCFSNAFAGLPMPYFHRGQVPRECNPNVRLQGVKWADAIMYRDKLDSGEWTVDEYNHFVGNEPGNEPPNIKMIVFGSHHINNLPDVNQRIKATKKAWFSMGWHYSMDQLTPKFLDLVLPASYKLETSDDYWYEGNPMHPFHNPQGGLFNYYVYGQNVITAPEEILPRDYFHLMVAKKLEKKGGVFENLAKKFGGDLLDVPLDVWHDTVHKHDGIAFAAWREENAHVEELYGGPLPSWEEFVNNGCIFRVPQDKPFVSYEDIFNDESDFMLPTLSGKIEFCSRFLELVDLNETRYCGHLDAIPRWKVTYDDELAKNSLFHSKAERLPLALITPVTQYRQHSLRWNNPILNGECYEHRIWMNPADAARRGIKDGDTVRVYNDLAEAHLTAYVTDRIAPRVANLYHGAWYNTAGEITERMPFGIDTAGACNLFTDMDFGKDNVNTFLTTALIEIEKM